MAGPAQGPAAALAPELSGKSEDALSQSQAWSTVVRRAARKQKRPPDAVIQNGRGVDYNKEQRRNVGIIGTGTEDNIPVIRTKLEAANAFAPTAWRRRSGPTVERTIDLL